MNSFSALLSRLVAKRRAPRQELADRIYQRQQDDIHRAGGAVGGDDARGLPADAAAGAAGAVNTGGPGAGF
jgi:hypothetical protein